MFKAEDPKGQVWAEAELKLKAGLRTDKTSGQAKSSGQAVAECEAKSSGQVQVEAEAEVKTFGQTEGCKPRESPTGTVFHMWMCMWMLCTVNPFIKESRSRR